MDYMSNGLIVLDCVYLRNGMVSQERKVLLASRAWRMKYYTCVVFFYLSPKQFQEVFNKFISQIAKICLNFHSLVKKLSNYKISALILHGNAVKS